MAGARLVIKLSVIYSAAFCLFLTGQPVRGATPSDTGETVAAELGKYCGACHNAKARTAGIVIDPAALAKPEGLVGSNAEVWERAVRQLRAKSMPPVGMPRPDAASYERIASHLETALNKQAASHPNPGDLPNLHRLTRTEYRNVIRDLLGLDNLPKEMDYTLLLPADNASSGFDNIADLLYVSPVVMERYLDTATKISRLAVGDLSMPLLVNIHSMPVQQPQTSRVEELPMGTRGGLAVKSYFPLDAQYEFAIELAGRSPRAEPTGTDSGRRTQGVCDDRRWWTWRARGWSTD